MHIICLKSTFKTERASAHDRDSLTGQNGGTQYDIVCARSEWRRCVACAGFCWASLEKTAHTEQSMYYMYVLYMVIAYRLKSLWSRTVEKWKNTQRERERETETTPHAAVLMLPSEQYTIIYYKGVCGGNKHRNSTNAAAATNKHRTLLE